MKIRINIIYILVIFLFLHRCSSTNIHGCEKTSKPLLTSEFFDKTSQKNIYLSDDLLLIPSLFVQVQNDTSLKVFPDGDSLRYEYKEKIESSKTLLCYEEIAVEITPLDGFTIEEVISAFSDTFIVFKIDGNKCCAFFDKNEDANQTVVNLLLFTPSETGKCFIATKVEGLLDLSKRNVEKIYKDFLLINI